MIQPYGEDVGRALILQLRRAAARINRVVRGFLVRNRAPRARYLDARTDYRGWNSRGITWSGFNQQTTGPTLLDRGLTAISTVGTGFTADLDRLPTAGMNIPLSLQ